jgi:peptide chain release factor 1
MSDNSLLNKLEAIFIRREEVGKLIVDPDIIKDMKRYVKLTQEYKDLEPLVEAYHDYKNTIGNIESSKEILRTESDLEFKEMAKIELDELQEKKGRFR